MASCIPNIDSLAYLLINAKNTPYFNVGMNWFLLVLPYGKPPTNLAGGLVIKSYMTHIRLRLRTLRPRSLF